MSARYEEFELDERAYDEMLDEIYGTVEICGMTFDSSRVLKEMDPIAYRVGMSDMESCEPGTWVCDDCGEEFTEDEEDEAQECCPAYDE